MSPTFVNSTSKRHQVLEALRDSMLAIRSEDGFNWTIRRCLVFSAQKLVLGGALPGIAIVPTSDTRLRVLSCGFDEYEMIVQVVGIWNTDGSDVDWIPRSHNMAGDIQQRLNDDRQLGGQVRFIEHTDVEVGEIEAAGANQHLALVSVTCRLQYRVSVSDVSA